MLLGAGGAGLTDDGVMAFRRRRREPVPQETALPAQGQPPKRNGPETEPPQPEDPARAAQVADQSPRTTSQARVASVSFQVADGRMILAALAGSGW